MRIRTKVELNRLLHDDLGWRRKENLHYQGWVDGASARKQPAILRGAITVLYAHWEGYVKTASEAYLSYVRERRLKHEELADNFVAISAKAILGRAEGSGMAETHNEIVQFFREEQGSRARIPKSDIINTKANLKPAVFRNIVAVVGLEYRPEYQVAEKPVIDRLIELRNDVAHGETAEVSEKEYKTLRQEIDDLLVLFCNDVDNAATTDRFLKSA